ncbi:MAG: GTPase Era [Candidatus Binatia bacterium]
MARAHTEPASGGAGEGEELPPDHRSGFVSIVGRPNAGKSTLLNRVLGRKIAAVTPKPQTTRRRLLGIKTVPQAQMLFIDTPGIHRARDVMNQRMVERATASLGEADVILWMVDAEQGLSAADREVAALLPRGTKPIVIGLNKIDVVAKPALLPQMAAIAALVPDQPIVPVSAETGANLEVLLDAVVGALPAGPRYYPADSITDEPERAIAAELIREKAMLETREEIPYAVAVSIDAFEEKPQLVVIKATLHVARDSQKPILIGQRGARIKAIGQAARADLEDLLGSKVFLELFVRVQSNWNTHLARLREFDL